MGIHPTTQQPDELSLPPGTVLGYRSDGRPIHVIAGAAEPEGESEGFDTEVTGEEPESGTEEEQGSSGAEEAQEDEAPKPKPPAKKTETDDWKPPSRDEWARTQAALKKANDDGKRHRLRNKELEDAARVNETDHEKAVREAREEGERRFREPMKRAGMRAALAEAGFATPDRLMKLIDWDAVTVDDEGDLVGVEAEVSRVRNEYPEFLPQEKPKPKARPTGAPRQPVQDKPKSTAEIHAARLLGKA